MYNCMSPQLRRLTIIDLRYDVTQFVSHFQIPLGASYFLSAKLRTLRLAEPVGRISFGRHFWATGRKLWLGQKFSLEKKKSQSFLSGLFEQCGVNDRIVDPRGNTLPTCQARGTGSEVLWERFVSFASSSRMELERLVYK